MRSSAILGPAAQFGSSTRRLFGSFGFQAKPMKTARVKRELTFMIPSSAVMWMEVTNLRRSLSISRWMRGLDLTVAGGEMGFGVEVSDPT